VIITLCGSARFEHWFHAWNEALSLSGHVVFALAAYPSQHAGVKNWYTPEDKEVLDAVHKGKIDASHAILVLNAFAYIGESTLSEIDHAHSGRKTVYFLESWGKGLGISEDHSALIRMTAWEMFKVPKDYGSPIDTFNDPGPWGLLPDAGRRRSAIVHALETRLKPQGSV
jgi:hypothetical protein